MIARNISHGRAFLSLTKRIELNFLRYNRVSEVAKRNYFNKPYFTWVGTFLILKPKYFEKTFSAMWFKELREGFAFH